MHSDVVFNGSASANNNAVAKRNGTRQTAVTGHNTRAPHNTVVCNLHKIVNFTAVTNLRSAKLTAIHARVSAYLHIISNNHIANMRNFHQTPAVFAGTIAKSVTANTHVEMKNTKTAYFTAFPNHGSRPNHGSVSNTCFIKNGHIWIKNDTITQHHVFSDITISPNFTVFTNSC